MASRPKFWPRPRPQRFGLGFRLEALASALASNIWPRPGLDLVVLLCNRAFFVQKNRVKFGNFDNFSGLGLNLQKWPWPRPRSFGLGLGLEVLILGPDKTKIEFVEFQNPIMPFPISLPFSPIFTKLDAFLMGRSKHCINDARWPIVVINTSHDAPRRPLGVPYRNWHDLNPFPKIPQNCAQCIYNVNMLI